MERPGWRNLLALPAFREDLVGVNVFVASHHGRESGCLTELFDIWRPEIFIISDKELQHDTQETTDWYRNRARGIPVRGTSDRRYVYTTRNDGTLQLDVQPTGTALITPITVKTWPASRSA
jgi:beta-lactamase superfamily II metal-dependent hydrolase